jgi:hypothetical protein
MDKRTKVLEVAKFIIEKTATIKMTADHFGMSTSSIKKYINNDLKEIDESIYNNVKIVQQNLMELGQVTGGKTGKRGTKYTEREALEIAETMLANRWTLEKASKYFKVPTSTIYERILSIEDPEVIRRLQELFRKNKIEVARLISRK